MASPAGSILWLVDDALRQFIATDPGCFDATFQTPITAHSNALGRVPESRFTKGASGFCKAPAMDLNFRQLIKGKAKQCPEVWK